MNLREHHEPKVREVREPATTLEELTNQYYSNKIGLEEYLEKERQLASRARKKYPSDLEKLLEEAAGEIAKQLQTPPARPTSG